MNRAFLFFLLLNLATQPLFGQERECTSDTVQVSTDLVRPRNLSEYDSLKTTPLSSRVGIYLRGASPVSSSGISMRAAAPAHTEVIWNGIPLASPLLAQADASLIPNIMLQQAGIREGGQAENGFVSGFGGSLLLGNRPSSYQNQAEVNLSAGSFGQWEQGLQLAGEKSALSGSLRCWNNTGKWDYPVRIGNFETRMQHQSRRFLGAEGGGQVRLGERHKIETGLWLQHSDRQLPGVFLEENPGGRQQDENQRYYLKYGYRRGKFFSNPMLGVSKDFLHFSDDKSGIDSRATSSGIYYRNESGLFFRQHRLCIQTHASRQEADAGQGIGRRRLWRSGIGLLPEWHLASDQIHFYPELRLEDWFYPETGRMDIALLPACRLIIRGKKQNSLKAGWQSRRRNPGLNDLYWPNAGNPDLRGERGFTSNLDWHYRMEVNGKWRFRNEAGVFYTRINDYLLWLPEGNFWKPQNSGLARMAGIRFRPSFQYHFSTDGFVSGELDFQLSHQELLVTRENQLQKTKLPYQPARQASVYTSLETRKFSVFLRGMHNSARSTGLFSSKQMLAYQLLDAGIRWQHTFSRISATVFFNANNVFNTSYYLLPSYPMPGRNFQFGTSLKIK